MNDVLEAILSEMKSEVEPGLHDYNVYNCCGCSTYDAIYADMRDIVRRHLVAESVAE